MHDIVQRIIVWFQKISILLPGRLLEIPRGRGILKATLYKEKYVAKLEFPEGLRGVQTKNLSVAGLEISARLLAQASVKTVGRVQVTGYSPGLASTIIISRRYHSKH